MDQQNLGALSDITVLDMTRVLSGPFAATWLGEINDELAQKSALCGSLTAQLQATQETITKQTEANATMREQVMSLLGLV